MEQNAVPSTTCVLDDRHALLLSAPTHPARELLGNYRIPAQLADVDWHVRGPGHTVPPLQHLLKVLLQLVVHLVQHLRDGVPLLNHPQH